MSQSPTTEPCASGASSTALDRAPLGQPAVAPEIGPSSRAAGMEPVQPTERYELIDIVRGFALSGVLIANLTVITFYGTTREMLLAMPTGDYELLVSGLLRSFIRGKFIFLFSLLFGLGLALQMERAAARGSALGSTYPRRLGVLFAFGVAHGVFLWWGDILHIYALSGLVLFSFRNRGDRFLLVCGGLLAVLPMTLFWCMPAIAAQLGADSTAGLAARSAWVAERTAALAEGGYTAVIQDNLQNYVRQDYRWLTIATVFYATGVFMVGFVLGRRRLLQEAPGHLETFRRLLRWGLLIGVPGGLCYAFDRSVDPASPWSLLLRLPIQVSLFALGGAYLASIVLLYQRPRPRLFLRLLAPVGRMALTNYLSHSVCYVFLFSSIGLGLTGKIGLVVAVLIALAIFLTQIVVSHLWFSRFPFGPAEWLWRKLTYSDRLGARPSQDRIRGARPPSTV